MDLKTYISAERGRAKQLASQLPNVSPSYLSQMASGTAPINPRLCVLIEQVTFGAVSRKDLYPEDWPDIWPELAQVTPP